MPRWLLSLLVFPLLAGTGAAEEVHHPELGLHVKLPDGWERDRSMEDVDNLLYATFAADEDGDKRILAIISNGFAKDFDADGWLAAEEEARKNFFDTITNKFKHLRTQEFGSKGSIGYSIAGLGTPDGEDEAIAVAFQVYAVVNGAYYWQVELISYKEAHLEKSEAVDAILEAIKFPKPKVPPLDLSVPEDAKPTEIKDEKGNIKWTLPPGWEMRGEGWGTRV